MYIKMGRMERQILRSLLAEKKSFWQLITEQDGDLSAYVALLNKWMETGIIEVRAGEIYITPSGLRKAERAGLRFFQDIRCSNCRGRGMAFEHEVFADTLKQFKEIAAGRPGATSEFDQGCVEPEITVARVQMLYRCGDLEGQDLFILGDDDLTSLAAALTGLPGRITVLEIDERVLEFIQTKAQCYGLKNISLHKFDVRDPLPEQFIKKYDHFVTDPVETLPGIKLFLSRCTQALKGAGGAGYFGLTHLEASRRKRQHIQRMILEMGFAITDIIRDFHVYILEREHFLDKDYPIVTNTAFTLSRPDRNWYTSDLFRIEAVSAPKPVQEHKITMGRELYLDDESYVTLP